MFNGQKNNHPLLRRKRRQRLTCRVRTVNEVPAKKIRILCKFLAKCKIPSRSYWHPPVCHTHTSHSGCKYGEKCQFRHNNAEETPSKKSKKGSAKGSVALLKKSPNCGCASQDSYPKKSILQKVRKKGSNASAGHTVKFSGGTWHQIKIRERKGPPRGTIQKCEPHERNPCAPRFEERSHEGHNKARELGPQSSVGLGEKHFTSSKIRTRPRFCSPVEVEAPVLFQKSLDERVLVVDSGASLHMLSKRDLRPVEMDTLRPFRTPTTVVTANGKVQTNEEAQENVHDLGLFVTVQLLEEPPAVISRKALQRTRVLL